MRSFLEISCIVVPHMLEVRAHVFMHSLDANLSRKTIRKANKRRLPRGRIHRFEHRNDLRGDGICIGVGWCGFELGKAGIVSIEVLLDWRQGFVNLRLRILSDIDTQIDEIIFT